MRAAENYTRDPRKKSSHDLKKLSRGLSAYSTCHFNYALVESKIIVLKSPQQLS